MAYVAPPRLPNIMDVRACRQLPPIWLVKTTLESTLIHVETYSACIIAK